jgi:hypothetical protein
MAVFNGMFPVLPGKEDAAESLAKQMTDPLRRNFDALQARADIRRETWTLQRTPAGSFVLVWFEGDVEKAFADLATDDSEFVTWLRRQIKDISGADLATPDDSPQPEVILDWSA